MTTEPSVSPPHPDAPDADLPRPHAREDAGEPSLAPGRSGKGGWRGRRTAIAGVTLCVVGALLAVLVLATGGWAEFGRRIGVVGTDARPADARTTLAVGDCFDESGEARATAQPEDHEVPDVEKASCDTPHHGEAYARFDLPDASYPGEGELLYEVDKRCAEEMSSYSADAWKLYRHATYSYYPPAEEDWSRGDRTAVCVFVAAGEGLELPSGLRQDRDAYSGHQRAYLEAAGEINAVLARVPLGDIEAELWVYQEWSNEVAGYLGLFSAALRDHRWEGEAAQFAAELADEADAVRTEWEKMRMLEDVEEFQEQWGTASLALADDTGATVFALRDRLGLSTERPLTTDWQFPDGSQLF